MKTLFNNLLFDPLYNALVYLIDILPGHNVALAVILLTIAVKLILFPISKSAVRTQMKMKMIQKPLEELREKYKDDRQQMSMEMLKLYRENGINPFSSIILILVQLPIILALYWVFLRGGLPEINADILYSFVGFPEQINMNFLGVNVAESKSVAIALLAAVTQHFVARYSFPKIESSTTSEPSFKNDLIKGMSVQMKYVLPVITFMISFGLISVVGLYWSISNLFAVGQEIYMRNVIKKPAEKEIAEASGVVEAEVVSK